MYFTSHGGLIMRLCRLIHQNEEAVVHRIAGLIFVNYFVIRWFIELAVFWNEYRTICSQHVHMHIAIIKPKPDFYEKANHFGHGTLIDLVLIVASSRRVGFKIFGKCAFSSGQSGGET